MAVRAFGPFLSDGQTTIGRQLSTQKLRATLRNHRLSSSVQRWQMLNSMGTQRIRDRMHQKCRSAPRATIPATNGVPTCVPVANSTTPTKDSQGSWAKAVHHSPPREVRAGEIEITTPKSSTSSRSQPDNHGPPWQTRLPGPPHPHGTRNVTSLESWRQRLGPGPTRAP
jgi:hypothetical protein